MNYYKSGIIFMICLLGTVANTFAQHTSRVAPVKNLSDIPNRIKSLSVGALDQIYRLTIAADVPDNNRPNRVHLKREPGHVFIILEKIDTVTCITDPVVWGFYPNRPITSLVFRYAKSVLRENDGREYDASISRIINQDELKRVIARTKVLASRKYNINKYNCYDYAIDIFNSVAGEDSLPYKHVKFPLIFGRGGSPCALYAQLKELKEKGKSVDRILIASGRAPNRTIQHAAGNSGTAQR